MGVSERRRFFFAIDSMGTMVHKHKELKKARYIMLYRSYVFYIAFLLFLAPSFGFASVPSFRVAVFDTQKALQTVQDGKKAIQKLKSEWKTREARLLKEREKIEKAMEDFRKQSTVMGTKAKEKKEMEIRQKMMVLQEKSVKASKEFQKKEHEFTKPILEKLKVHVEKISREKKYSLVLDTTRSTVLFVLPENDITDEVIKAYDKGSK